MIFRFSFLLFVFTYVNVYTVSASSNRKSTFTDWYFIDIHLAYSQEAHLFETVYMEASYPAARVTRLTGLKKHAVYMLPSYPASMKHMFWNGQLYNAPKYKIVEMNPPKYRQIFLMLGVCMT